MAGSYVQKAQAQGQGVTSITTVSMNTTTGNTVAVSVGSGPTFSSLTDNGTSNTVTTVADESFTGLSLTVRCLQNINGRTGHTFTANFSGADYVSMTATELTSVLAASLDTASITHGTDTASPYTLTSGTFAQADEIVLLFNESYASGVSTYAESTGFTSIGGEGDNNNYCTNWQFYKNVTSTSAITPSLTDSTGTGYAGMLMVVAGFKSSGGGGGGVTAALTGNAATAAVGTAGVTHTQPLTGNAATGAAGTVKAGTSKALTGNAAAAAVGTVGPSVTVGLTGVSGTGAAGTVSASSSGSPVTVGLTGVSGTGAAGTVAPSSSKALTGNSATAAAGTVAPGLSSAISGTAATASTGSVSPSTSAALAGNAAAGAVGTLTPGSDSNVTVGITGVAAAAAAGNVAPSLAAGLTGAPAAAAVGLVAPGTAKALTGVSAASAVGNVARDPNITVGLSGVSASALAGNVTPTGGEAVATGNFGFEIGGSSTSPRRPAPRRLPERNFVPILERALAAKAPKVKPPKERAQKFARAIEIEAAAKVVEGATAPQIANEFRRWLEQGPAMPAGIAPMEVFLAQVGFRIRQAESERAALDNFAAATLRRRQDDEEAIALLVLAM